MNTYESVGDENSNQGYLTLIAGPYQPLETAVNVEEREPPNTTLQEVYCSLCQQPQINQKSTRTAAVTL